jgi:hypothetical protein
VKALLLLAALPVAAQVRVGDFSTDLSGTIAPGYTATYGNMIGSSHQWILGGDATMSGFYYSPNFLSFNANVYLNQSRANSNFQSISNASGVNLTSTLFGGSYFPGSINYSKAFNSEGNYAVPGLTDYVTHGDSDTFGVTWSENVPKKPSFSAGYQMGSSQYTVYGTKDEGENRFHSLNLHSGYTLEGFNMAAFYTMGGSHSLIPQVVTGEAESEVHAGNDACGFNVTHALPMHGTASASINRSSWNSEYMDFTSKGTIDLVNALAAFRPTEKLSVSVSAGFSDNLAGQLYQPVIAAGGVVPGLNSNDSSNSLDLIGVVTYSPGGNLQTSAVAERRTQYFMGETYGVQSYGGGATYMHRLFDGSFNASLNATDNIADQTGENTLGFSTTENYSTVVLGWHVTGSFGYSQNAQTLLVTYMNSFYHYSVNARRNWGRFNVGAGAGAARTGLTGQAGTLSSSESYNASLGYGSVFVATGSYSKSDGQALATGGGLVPIPPPGLPSNLVTLFGGDSYSLGLSSTPVKHLTLAATYGKSISNTANLAVSSANHNEQFNALVQYQVRKLNFTSGYARLDQGFSGSGTEPEVISSFYMGLSRWFNFF